jgi:hypothetical protein
MHLRGFREHLRERRDDLVVWRRRRAHRKTLPPLEARDRPVVEALRRDGVCTTSLRELDFAETTAMVAAADRLFGAIDGRPPGKGGYCVSAGKGEIEAYPELIRWGLNERLLAIVAHYLELPVAYRGLTVRQDIKGGDQVETRLWHRDAEDKRIVKAIVYLNDVDRGGGAFEVIPGRYSPPTWRAYRASGRLDDDDMASLVPRSRWRTCSGPRGTVVITDTCSVFHRGQIAESEDRRALFFCYNSSQPLQPAYCEPLVDLRLAANPAGLSQLQRSSIGS